MKRFALKFVKQHQPAKWILDTKQLPLRKGVLCPQCDFHNEMRYQQGKWYCPRCFKSDESAVLLALYDYALLFSDSMSNRDFREFVGITSASAAYKKLQELNLIVSGERRYRKYHISLDILERLK